MMSQAGRDPLFWATVAVAERDFSGSGDLCLRCHASDGWVSGRSTPTDGSGLGAGDGTGVACDLCHRLTNPDTSEWLGVQTAPFLAHDDGLSPKGWYGSGMFVLWASTNEKLGPYADAVPPHAFLQSKLHRDAKQCGTCHDVSNSAVGDLAPGHGAQVPLPGSFSGVPGAPVDQKAAFNNPPYAYGMVERTFSEHQASGFATLHVSDYGTLPADLKQGSIETAWLAATAATPSGNYVDGTPRTFTCQTCHMRPVTGKGCNKTVPTRTDLPQHDLTGASYWAGDAIEWLDAQSKLVLGGGMTATELAALDDGQTRALATLQDAARLDLDGNTLRVINLTGHKLITGYPEGRRLWIHARWHDAAGQLVREDGAYGPLLVQHQGQPLTVQTLLQLDPPDTRIYRAGYGMTQAWAARLIDWGWPASLPLAYDRATAAVTLTLGQLKASPPGTTAETFHFVLNDVLLDDTRIPPWGFAYDAARERNTLPVPTTQYGNPGPGGTYHYWDEVALAPPAGAVQADIELLYQSTSWEYLQFLALTNIGGSAFLASTGDDLVDAWLATGMAAPQVVDNITWTGSAPPDPWSVLGFGLAGVDGIPQLTGSGTLQPLSSGALHLQHGAPSAPLLLMMSLAVNPVPFKGGTLVTVPVVSQFFLATNGSGELLLPWASWPAGVPAGITLVFQAALQDAAAVKGVAISQAIQALTP
jgi:hypothetical protein